MELLDRFLMFAPWEWVAYIITPVLTFAMFLVAVFEDEAMKRAPKTKSIGPSVLSGGYARRAATSFRSLFHVPKLNEPTLFESFQIVLRGIGGAIVSVGTGFENAINYFADWSRKNWMFYVAAIGGTALYIGSLFLFTRPLVREFLGMFGSDVYVIVGAAILAGVYEIRRGYTYEQ